MVMENSSQIRVGRDAKTGRFVTVKFAELHPDTTIIHSHPRKSKKHESNTALLEKTR
jgi:hypothetical protein